MDVDDLLLDGFGRIRDLVLSVVEGLDEQQLSFRPAGSGNPVGWLVWHLTRVQDSHVADAFDAPEVWLDDRWQERFALDLPPEDTGYGHDSLAVGEVHATAGLLAGYHAAVTARTESFLRGMDAEQLDRVVDRRWSPPVTLGVRLLSVVSDCLQHLGQASYVRGLQTRDTADH